MSMHIKKDNLACFFLLNNMVIGHENDPFWLVFRSLKSFLITFKKVLVNDFIHTFLTKTIYKSWCNLNKKFKLHQLF